MGKGAYNLRSYLLAALIFVAPLPVLSASLTQWALHSPEEVQRALARKGFSPGQIDGQWGKKSINALKAFQRANGLKPTGVFDDAATGILFPAEKPAPTPTNDDAKAATTIPEGKVKEIVAQPKPIKASKPALITETKDVESNVAKQQPVSKVEVIVEKPKPSPQHDDGDGNSQAVDTSKDPRIERALPQSWMIYTVVGAFSVLLLSFAVLRRRKASVSVESVLAGARRSDPLPPVEAYAPQPRERAEPEPEPQYLTLPSSGEEVISDLPPPREPISIDTGAILIPAKDNEIHSAFEEISVKPSSTDNEEPQTANFRVSLAAHNRSIADFVNNNRVVDLEQKDEPNAPAVGDGALAAPAMGGSDAGFGRTMATSTVGPNSEQQQTTSTDQSMSAGVFGRRPFFGTARRADDTGPITLGGKTSDLPRQSGSDCWVVPGRRVFIGDISFDRGLVYVGSYLAKRGASQEAENCLIDPRQKVAPRGDPDGTTMGYWPSYSRIMPEARRSYLEWLASGRDRPDAYIGYVFLYFYGLERRLMLDSGHADGDLVAAEVERLLAVYGSNNSFNRYARDLLSAYELKAGLSLDGRIPEADGGGYDVPMPIKLALGVRVRDGRPFEPELLMKYALCHPETKVRTPARRAPELLSELFAQELNARHPEGLTIKAGRFKKLAVTYRACSGSFTVDVAASDGSIPDISDRAEPITTARTIFEACSDKLDEYSRALGRSPGLQRNLAIVAKLPNPLRDKVARSLPGNPLATLAQIAATARPIILEDLMQLSSIEPGNGATKGKLRELSQLLASYGFGNTADPVYMLRLPMAEDPVLVFPLTGLPIDPSEAYRSAQLTLMLGMMVGHADGDFSDAERSALRNQVEQNPRLSMDDKARLNAEMLVGQQNPAALEEWTKRLKELSPATRGAVSAELVAIAAADGNLHSAEMRKLEVLFKRMGLDPQTLYALLHESGSKRHSDDDMTVIIPAAETPGAIPIPRPPTTAAPSIDLAKLKAIRHETTATAIILEGILGDVDEPAEMTLPEPVVIDDGGTFDGLELRYGALVSELRIQPEWSKEDFDTLARNASLMPSAALRAINDWSIERFDELLIEGEDPLMINAYILPPDPVVSPDTAERIST